MGNGERDAGQRLNDFSYALECPQVCIETMSPGTLQQCLLDGLQLSRTQFRRTPRLAGALQCFRATLRPLLVPVAHALAADTKETGYVGLLLLFLEESSRPSPSLLQNFKIFSLSSFSLHAGQDTWPTSICQGVF